MFLFVVVLSPPTLRNPPPDSEGHPFTTPLHHQALILRAVSPDLWLIISSVVWTAF